VGYVSSGGYAHHAKKSMAMGYVPIDCVNDGTELEIELLGDFYRARVVARPVYDPNGQRMRA
jgi:dimethylglycine dehydrogenase